jgi:tetratricopeptide (TPR) repeat protein
MISKRLGIDVDTIFELTTNSRMDYMLEFKRTVRELVRGKKYEALFVMIESEKNNPIFIKNPYNKQFLLWHKGICMFYLKNDPTLALGTLHEALKLTLSTDRYFNEREMEIMNSLAIIHFEIGNYKKAVDTYNKILNSIRYPAQIYDNKIKIRIYYNLAKALTRLKKYKSSNDVCYKAISICINSEYFYLLGELYYHIGYNYFLESNKERYLDHFKKAISIFELTEKKEYINLINDLLNKEK